MRNEASNISVMLILSLLFNRMNYLILNDDT